MNSSSTSPGITAAHQANQYIRKSVFYIGNVDKSVSLQKMQAFVSSLSVEVVSLFETNPRRVRQPAKQI
jgi:hypothetical protein